MTHSTTYYIIRSIARLITYTIIGTIVAGAFIASATIIWATTR